MFGETYNYHNKFGNGVLFIYVSPSSLEVKVNVMHRKAGTAVKIDEDTRSCERCAAPGAVEALLIFRCP